MLHETDLVQSRQTDSHLTSALISTCPYSILLDRKAAIAAAGKFIQAAECDPVGRPFFEVFSIRKGGDEQQIYDQARAGACSGEAIKTRFEITLLDSDDITLVGSFLPISSGGLIFIGTLAPSHAEDLDKLRLTLRDFAPFDVLPDFAMMAQVNHAVLNDTQVLNKKLSSARDSAVKAHAEIEVIAMHDSLTGVGNRTAFQRMVDETDTLIRQSGDFDFHMLLMDVNRFKPINDQFGHHVGDQILAEMGKRIAATLCESGSAFRLGGDEFAIFYRGISRERAFENANLIIEKLGNTYMTNEVSVAVTASGGFASVTTHTRDCTSLYKAADIALYSAKDHTGTTLKHISPQLIQDALEHERLEGELSRAIDQRQMSNAYQLQFDIDTGAIAGVEALARWFNPRRGALIPPAEFIPIAERIGSVPMIDLSIFEEALLQIGRWRQQGRSVPVSTNLSPITLEWEGLVDGIESLLAIHGVDARDIEFEITETAIIRDCEAVQANLAHLKRLGCKIALDDFGAGQTSLSQLAGLPITRLKLDRSLILGIDTDNRKRRVVGSLIDLAKSLDLKITVEGVETEVQAGIIREIGGVSVQGFLFAKPQFATDFTIDCDQVSSTTFLPRSGFG